MRLNMFATKILGVFAAVMLLAACESTPSTTANTSSTGTASGATGGSTSTSSVTPGSVSDFTVNVGDRVFFDLNKYDLKADARATLDKQAAWLKQYPKYAITIEGHCDERGTREYNMALGERRATSTKNYLVNLGVPAARIKTISYGKERPVALGHNEDAWKQNRRAVTVLN
jgi:peptidoglycan-associated lipoprotein